MLAAHLLLAKVLIDLGQMPAAEASLEEALRLGVSRTEVLPLLGRVYLRLGEPAKLLERVRIDGMPTALHAEILTMRGTAQAMSGQLPAASASFAQARAADERSPEPLVAEAAVLTRFGEVKQAVSLARKATEVAPRSAMAWHQLGNAEQALGNTRIALDAQERAIALAPKLVDAHVGKASLLIGLDRRSEAAALLKQLQDWKVSEPRASYLRAVLQAGSGDTKAASASWTEAVNLIDPMPPALRSSSEPLLLTGALSHRALGNVQKALEYLDTLLARNPRHFAGRLLQASYLIEKGEGLKAKVLVDELLRQAPAEAQVLALAGRLAVLRRQFDQAAGYFERAQAAGAGSSALRDLALSQSAMGQGKLAMANLEKVVAQNPRDVRAAIELAVAYARQGMARKAVATAEALVARAPDDATMLNFLGNIQGRLGDQGAMRAAYERALEKAPTYQPTVINLSRLDLDQNHVDAARARLLAWTKDHAKDAEALFFLGVAERRAGRHGEALQAWERAQLADRRDARARLASVDLLLELRRHDEALVAARNLAGDRVDSVLVQHLLARAYLAAGQRDAARSTLKEALKLAGFDPAAVVQTGRFMLAAGDVDGAAYAASKAIQSKPDHLDALVLNAEVAGRRNDGPAVDKALAELERRHRGALPALLVAGHVALSRQQAGKALAYYDQAYAKAPSAQIALLRARAHLAGKQPERALAVVEDARRRFADDAALVRTAAEVRVALGKTSEALRDFEALIQSHPKDAGLHGSLAELMHALRDPRALATAEKAMALDPRSAVHAARYGWMLVLDGKIEPGVRVLRDARLRDPSDGRIRWQLAEALLRVGQKDEAREELRAALAAPNPPRSSPDLDRIRQELGV